MSEPLVRDSAGVTIHGFPQETLERAAGFTLAAEPAIRIGALEGPKEYQWTRPVAGTRLSDGGFAVLEQVPAEIRIFDGSGTFVRRIGAAGDGPGEFRSPAGMVAIPGDTLVVWDRGARRLTWFSPEGDVLRDRVLQEPGGVRTFRRVVLAPGGEVAVLGPTTSEGDWGLENEGQVRERWRVVALSAADASIEELGEVPGTELVTEVSRSESGQVESVNVSGRWWWGEGFASAGPEGVWTADQLALEVRHFDFQEGLDRVIRIASTPRPFTSGLIDSLHREEIARVSDPELRELWRADFEGRSYPASVPPVAGVFADGVGRVWVGLTDPPPEPLASDQLKAIGRWVLFSTDPPGDPVGPATSPTSAGLVTIPARSHPLWADDEGVLILRIDDEFDVPYVEWFPFVEGEP